MITTGVYKTKQRDLVLACLSHAECQHLTADEICSILQRQGTPVGKSTVYRYLNLLVQDGIVMKYVIAEGQPACYQYIACREHSGLHYHLKCNQCGKLFHVESAVLDNLAKNLNEQFDFQLDITKTVLYGKCQICQNSKCRNGER